jgi:hypothetical protein
MLLFGLVSPVLGQVILKTQLPKHQPLPKTTYFISPFYDIFIARLLLLLTLTELGRKKIWENKSKAVCKINRSSGREKS